MKQPQIVWVAAVLLFGLCPASYAQEGATAAGGDASGSGGTVAYSVGQVAYTGNTGSTGSVSQGVQQAYRISSAGVGEPGIQLRVAAYPNPTTDWLVLDVENDDFQDLAYQLFDLNGKRLSGDRLTGPKTNISMLTLVPATYYVTISRGKTLVKTFTIIKTM